MKTKRFDHKAYLKKHYKGMKPIQFYVAEDVKEEFLAICDRNNFKPYGLLVKYVSDFNATNRSMK